MNTKTEHAAENLSWVHRQDHLLSKMPCWRSSQHSNIRSKLSSQLGGWQLERSQLRGVLAAEGKPSQLPGAPHLPPGEGEGKQTCWFPRKSWHDTCFLTDLWVMYSSWHLTEGDPGPFYYFIPELDKAENSTHSIIRFKYINARKTF